MSLPDRRRRRARPSLVVAVVLAAAVLAVVVGAMARVGSVSDPYWRTVDRSYAAQGRVLVDQSNRSATQLRQLLAGWAGQSRRVLEVQLDLLVRSTARTATAAAALSPPAPWHDLGTQFAAALGDRAQAVARLRSAVDGLLGMAPLPVPTAGATTPSTAALPAGGRASATLSPAQAASELGAAGALLERADRGYGRLRRAFARAPGGAQLPTSRWVVDPATWARGPVQTVVDQLAGAPNLAPRHAVELLPTAVSITPAPLPSGGKSAPPNQSLLPPTRSIGVTAVVADQGNVAERSLVVTVALTPAGGGKAAQHSVTMSLAAGASEAAKLARLPARPGRTYQLTVAVTAPPGEAPGLPTSQTYAVAVAPNAPPPPTTTTTTPTTRGSGKATTTTTPKGSSAG